MINGPGVEKGIARIYFKKIHRDVSGNSLDKEVFKRYLETPEYTALCERLDAKRTGELGRKAIIGDISHLSLLERDAYLFCVARRGLDSSAANSSVSERQS